MLGEIVFSERFHDASIASSEIAVLVSVPVALPSVNLADRERSGSRTLSWRVISAPEERKKLSDRLRSSKAEHRHSKISSEVSTGAVV